MIKKISENIWEIPKEGKMNVPGKIFASDLLMKNIEKDGKTIEQIKNIAQLQGIVGASLAMPDAHQGYGMAIGGVAAFDIKEGIISPGGVGFDIGCGVRLLASSLSKEEFLKKRKNILEEMGKHVPTGTGKGSDFSLTMKEIDQVLEQGVKWAVTKGY